MSSAQAQLTGPSALPEKPLFGCVIFMAYYGRRGVTALLLGSETNKVLTHSKIPVLVYR